MNQPSRISVAGGGSAVAILLLLSLEGWLHTDDFLTRYRAVFAAGRAMDKVLQVEASKPRLLVMGNSRVDNGIDPNQLDPATAGTAPGAFNLGIPGADACDFYGIGKRLEAKGLLGAGGIRHFVFGLDESFFQRDPSLGYSVFFSDRNSLLQQGYYRDWFATWLRLWGFSANLKTLHEPEKAIRFAVATFRDVEPYGGSAATNFGFRPGESGKFQDAGQLARQEAGTKSPPEPGVLACFWSLVDLAAAHGVKTAVVYMPLLNRPTQFEYAQDASADPYQAMTRQFSQRGIPAIALHTPEGRLKDDFANAGHLNAQGARRYSALLAERLRVIWPELAAQ